jgi:hypothetical protein
MSESDSWLPPREQDLVDLCKKWDKGLNDPAAVAAFGWNQTEVTGTVTPINRFLIARAAYQEDNSSKNRLTKDEAKDAGKDAMRDFANTSIRYNKLMTEEQKREYGIHTPGSGSPIPVPTTSP